MSDHAASELRIRPVVGLPEFRPGDDVAAAIAAAAPWINSGDVIVVTSKVISKAEGRIVAAPTDPEARDALRRELVAAEAVRVLAQFKRTLITENRLGIVAAASGVDGSNVDAGELALLPIDPDASAAVLRSRLHALLGVEVAVVITDTMGRAWRNGQIDAAIGSAGLSVLHGYAGSTDKHGNDLLVTSMAIADELSAAADLVKGKLGGVPVAVVSGYPIVDDGSVAADLIRRHDDLFWLGADAAISRGRSESLRLRKSVREFSSEPVDPDVLRRAVALATTAPAPHHTRPVRFVWLRSAVRGRLLDAMGEKWRADLAGDGLSEARVAARLSRGDILYRAPEVIIPFGVPDGAHTYPDRTRQDAESTMFTVAAGAAVQALLVALATEGVGSCWIGSTIFAPDIVRAVLDVPPDWNPLGAIAIGHPTESLEVRPQPALWDGLLQER